MFSTLLFYTLMGTDRTSLSYFIIKTTCYQTATV